MPSRDCSMPRGTPECSGARVDVHDSTKVECAALYALRDWK
jgi:hypothetical protein